MKKLHLRGWLGRDQDGVIALATKKNNDPYRHESIPYSILQFDKEAVEYDDDSLGGMRSVIPNASIRMYVTGKECSLEEAVEALVLNMCGAVDTNIAYCGYSEWTITGYDLARFTIGGHDLSKCLETYIGKYVHFLLEY